MSMIETLQLWSDAVASYEKKNFAEALSKLQAMNDTSAKIMFNIGCACLVLGQTQQALVAFQEAVKKDEHLAVGYFLLGQLHLQSTSFHKASRSFDDAVTSMRGKMLIDYKQLGLKYKLEVHEVLINQAVCLVQLRRVDDARDRLLEALQSSDQPVIKHALHCLQAGKNIKAIEFPNNLLFQPPKSKIANMQRRDYLGKAKVIVSADNDMTTGFQEALKTQQATPGERFQALYDFSASTAQELSVTAGDIVQVTEKGVDGWYNATLLRNNTHGLVPGSYLEKEKVQEFRDTAEREALLVDLRKKETRKSLKQTVKPPNKKLPPLPKGVTFGGKRSPVQPSLPTLQTTLPGNTGSSRPPPPTISPPPKPTDKFKPPVDRSSSPAAYRKSSGTSPNLPVKPPPPKVGKTALLKDSFQEPKELNVKMNLVTSLSVKMPRGSSFQELLSSAAHQAGLKSSTVSLWYEWKNTQVRITETNIKEVMSCLEKGEYKLWCYAN